jgi:hypothetical protein
MSDDLLTGHDRHECKMNCQLRLDVSIINVAPSVERTNMHAIEQHYHSPSDKLLLAA